MKFLHSMVRVRDLDESMNFYCQLLGLIEVNRVDVEAGRFTLVYLAAPADEQRAHEEQAPLIELTWN